MPETELSPEEQAARQAELEEAKAAIHQADSAEAVVSAYADAPPTAKAATQPLLQPRIAEVSAADQQEFQSGLPEFHATMGGADVPEVPEVTAPAAGAVALEEGVPAPAPEVELPPTPAPEPYRENDEVIGFLSRLFGGDPSAAVGRSLNEIETTDPELETSPGPKPKVPLEGETDPQRVEDQSEAAKVAAEAQRAEAMRAVMEGRGPEQVQLKEMDEATSAAELRELQPAELTASSEAEQLAQLQMPEEVLARFDADLGSSMQESMAGAREQFAAAETERDTQREQSVATAEAEQERVTAEADEQQRAHVQDARQTIQTERQGAIDGQAAAVGQLESDAEQARAATQTDIADRVAEDERQVGERYDAAEAEAQAEVDRGEREAEQKRLDAEKEAEDASWWEQAVDFVKDCFDALKNAIGAIFDAIRSAISTILDAVKSAVKGLIDLCADFVKGAIAAFGEALKGLVDMTIGQVFPELAAELNAGIDAAVSTATEAVDAVAEGLKAGVDFLVDNLNKALNAILDVFEGAINLALSVMEAVITGDWSGLAKKLLESVLGLLGIDPEAFYAFIGRVMDTISLIIDDPLGFLGNLVDSVVLGIQKFADNFLTHLQAGVVAWLTGALGNLQIPAEFNLAGLLDLARQVLGLTWDWVRAKAVKLVGEENVERLEYLFSYVQTLIEGGFPALWERLKQDLGNLVDRVLAAISDYLQVEVIIAGIKWLASLFNPVGAIVKLVMTIWNLYTFLRDQLSRIVAIVTSVVEGLGDIARGIIEGAALKVEGALANLLPVAIDLVAKLLGLTGVSEKVREIIAGIREAVDKAIDRLLEMVLKAFRPKPAGAGAEGGAARPPAADDDVGTSMKVDVPTGADHTLTIAASGADAVPMLASDPLPVSTWLDTLAAKAAALTNATDQKAATKSVTKARAALDKLDPEADTYLGLKAKGGTPSEKAVTAAQGKLRDALVEAFTLLGDEADGSPILAIFKAQVDLSHQDVQKPLTKALADNADAWQVLQWADIRMKLIAGTNTFNRPLLAEHAFGKAAQDTLRQVAKAKVDAYVKTAAETGSTVTIDLDAFISSWVVRLTHKAEPGPFALFLDKLRAIQFEKGDLNCAEMGAAVDEALKLSQAGDEQVDPAGLKEIRDIVEFLCALASEAPSYGSLDLVALKDRWWAHPPNKKFIMDKFRRGGGLHEWIPTSYIPQVIARGTAAKGVEGVETAALWVRFQDAFRSPTEVLMYPPQGRYLRTVPYRRDPVTHDKTKDGEVAVIQGHVGAVYAPVDDQGYREDVIQQTVGQGPWHDELRKIFDANAGTGRDAMRGVIGGMEGFIVDNLWYGDTLPKPGFNEYYAGGKAKADGKDVRSAKDLAGIAKGAATSVKKDFEDARAKVNV
jgi:hypothetical protein